MCRDRNALGGNHEYPSRMGVAIRHLSRNHVARSRASASRPVGVRFPSDERFIRVSASMIPSSVSRAVALVSVFGFGSFVEARDWHVLPSGAGGKSGASWEQAANAAQLQALADQLQPGDRLLLGSGEYKNLSFSIKASGAPGKPI